MDRALHAVHVEAEAEPAGQAGAVPGVRGAASVHAEEDALGACVGVLAPACLEAVGEQGKVKACGKPAAQILVHAAHESAPRAVPAVAGAVGALVVGHAEEAAPCRPAAAGFCPVACGKTGLAGFPAPRRRSLGQALEHARKEAPAELVLASEGMGDSLVEGIGGQLGERPVNTLP